MKRLTAISVKRLMAVTGFALMVLAVLGSTAPSNAGVAYRGAADIRVWLEDDYDIYPSMDDVVFCVRAARDCHALIYIVDTDGFIHVVHPFSPYESAWIEGGYTYRFTAREAGLYGFGYDRGIAFIYAVGSPHPFVYADYGINIFAGRFAFRISGDPFFACKSFYISLLPHWCNRSLIGVSYAHFYVRDWVRYPWYLCSHRGVGHRMHRHCNHCAHIYDGYRHHARDPYRILNPTARYKGKRDASLYSTVASVSEKKRTKILHERGLTKHSKRTAHNVLKKSGRRQDALRDVPRGSKKIKMNPSRKTVRKPVVQTNKQSKQSVRKQFRSNGTTSKKPTIDKRIKIQSPRKSVVRSSKEMVKREKSRTTALKKTVRTNKGRVVHEKARAKAGAPKTKQAVKKAVRTKKSRGQ
jgi:hypothetical protein